MQYVISDHHFYHKNVIKYENRKFENITEMNDFMINEWNSVVKINDLVYHLGDICFSGKAKLFNLLNKLNGKIYLIPGNHDPKGLKRFEWIDNKLFVGDSITEKKVLINNKYEKVVMCHYPLGSWSASFHNRKLFYGHTHSNDNFKLNNAYNVCCDVIGYKPLTFQQVVDK